MYCSHCGKEIPDGSQVCHHCWTPLKRGAVREENAVPGQDAVQGQGTAQDQEPAFPRNIIVTTGDLQQPYEVLGPVYFQVSNKGIFGSALSTLRKQYTAQLQEMKRNGTMSEYRADWGFLYGEWSVGQSDFEAAFYIATQELKKRAEKVGADAVICMRQDIDLDTNGFAFFYLQMYGTAVRFK